MVSHVVSRVVPGVISCVVSGVARHALVPLLIFVPFFVPFLAGQSPPSPVGALQVHVIEGDGVSYPAGSRATRGVTVLVADPAGQPVNGAIVGFRLPDDGPGGVFSTGAKTEIVTTGADGRASVWGMRWSRTPGPFEIRITAEKGQTRGLTACRQSLSAQASNDSSSRHLSSGSHKWLWIALVVAGAAASGIAIAGLTGKSTGTPSSTTGVQIGTPSINLGSAP